MSTKYKGYTFTITYEGDNVVASWRNLSAEAFTVERACHLCWQLIQEGEIDG